MCPLSWPECGSADVFRSLAFLNVLSYCQPRVRRCSASSIRCWRLGKQNSGIINNQDAQLLQKKHRALGSESGSGSETRSDSVSDPDNNLTLTLSLTLTSTSTQTSTWNRIWTQTPTWLLLGLPSRLGSVSISYPDQVYDPDCDLDGLQPRLLLVDTAIWHFSPISIAFVCKWWNSSGEFLCQGIMDLWLGEHSGK